MEVKEINWIDKSSGEASVVISDGSFECTAFSHPCCLKVGDKIIEPLQSLYEPVIYRVENRDVSLKHQPGKDFWSHELVAIVTDKDTKLVQIGRLRIRLTALPGDVLNGDLIECCPSRLDIVD